MSDLAILEAVTKRYGSLTAVENVDLALRAGETVALVGHNGAGKTTLVKLILGLIAPSSGKVSVFGSDPTSRHGAGLREALGFLPENVAFHGAMTGRELLTFYARLKRQGRAEVDSLLGRVGLAEAAVRRVSTFSKGMRQRLGLAQALIGSPDLLLLDEPTSGLDPASRAAFYRTVDELRSEEATTLISTHALAEIEDHADRIAVMHRGHLIALGSLEELRRSAALPVRLTFTVTPCNTGRLLERFGSDVEVIGRCESRLEVGCAAMEKTELLRRLDGLWHLIVDFNVDSPGLPAVYSHLVEKEERP